MQIKLIFFLVLPLVDMKSKGTLSFFIITPYSLRDYFPSSNLLLLRLSKSRLFNIWKELMFSDLCIILAWILLNLSLSFCTVMPKTGLSLSVTAIPMVLIWHPNLIHVQKNYINPVLVEVNNVQSSVSAGAMIGTDANYQTTQDSIKFMFRYIIGSY